MRLALIQHQATQEERMVLACWSKCSSREKFSTWLADIISMKFFLNRHSALQWGLPLDLIFYFSKDIKHFGRTFLSLNSNLEWKSSQLLLLSWIFQLMTVHFAFGQLELTHQREDYRELLELTLMFLGRVPPRGMSFIKPGTIHRARFMSRLIYTLKIVLFRDAGFKLTKRETQGLVCFCVLVAVVYIKSWFFCRLRTAAPANDLNLLTLFVQVESPSAKGALKKLCGQLWYLSEELVALAFFDRDVDASEKREMVEGQRRVGEEDPPKRISVDPSTLHDKRLSSFVTSDTKNFF